MANFVFEPSDYKPSFDLEEGETILGYYTNDAEDLDKNVVFTNFGLILHYGVWEKISYADIESIDSDQDKRLVDRLYLNCRNGSISVPIVGGKGKVRDAWEVLRYIKNVRADLLRLGVSGDVKP